MTAPHTLCVMVNKDNAAISLSETFLRAHISRLPFPTLSVVGNPGGRRRDSGMGAYLLPRGTPARALRWVLDRSGAMPVATQDARSLARYLRAESVAVVLAEYGPTALSVMDACDATGVPLVSHFHGWDAYVLASQPEHRARYRRLFERSEAIIAVSRHMRQHLLALGAPAERTIWNPCGAEPDPTPAAPANAPPLFVSVGRSTPKKAVCVILLAFAEVVRRVPDARLELAGGDADPIAHQLTRSLDLSHAVHFRGPMEHGDVLDLIRRSRCYVHPSVTAPDGDMEGTPVSVLEAMAAGVPVVSSRHGGIIDLLEATSAGILAPEFDVGTTADAMLCYATDAERAGRDGREGRRLLESRWSMDHSLASLTRIIDAARQRDRAALAALAQDSR